MTFEGWPGVAASRHLARDRLGRRIAASCEITNIELCLDDLIAADLLPAPAERAEWAAELGTRVHHRGRCRSSGKSGPLSMGTEIERAGIDARRSNWRVDQGAGVGQTEPSKGRWSRYPVAIFAFRGLYGSYVPMVNWGPALRARLAVFQGRRWYGIEVDSATVRQAFPKPLRVERRMLDEAEQLYAEGGSEPASARRGVDA